MHSLTMDVLLQLERWLLAGDKPWLCTIVETLGSSPRPIGSMLGFCEGQAVGTLSGGCVEEELLAKLAIDGIDARQPRRITYGVTAADNERLGLPCGGRLEVLVERLDGHRDHWVSDAVHAVQSRRVVARRLDLASGASVLETVSHYQPLVISDTHMDQYLGPPMRMILVGAGQLAHVLSSLALAMDFDVLVTDPREQVLAQWTGPDLPLIHGLPDDVILQQSPDAQTVIITLTHDPRIDDMALLEALESDAWYVGALGSLRTTASRLQRLRELGLSEPTLARLHAPVGLPIGSKTPWEIAVAIMAEITQTRQRPQV